MWFGGQRLHDVLVERIVRHACGFHPFGTPTPQELALATIPAKVAAGYRSICFKPSMFTDDVGEVARVCRAVVAALDG